jgi:hypothetical protein
MRAYEDSVFINVPFDRKYSRLGDAILFALYECGFVARSALEVEDSGQARVDKILDIIEQSKFGIHDIPARALTARRVSLALTCRSNWGSFLGQNGSAAKRIVKRDASSSIAPDTAIAISAQTFRVRTFEFTTISRGMRSARSAIG